MKIKYTGQHGPMTSYKELLKELFYIGRYEWDEADYGFSIILFGRNWNWLIYKDKETYLEYKQEETNRNARYLQWANDN
jgi:hypothetical protein